MTDAEGVLKAEAERCMAIAEDRCMMAPSQPCEFENLTCRVCEALLAILPAGPRPVPIQEIECRGYGFVDGPLVELRREIHRGDRPTTSIYVDGRFAGNLLSSPPIYATEEAARLAAQWAAWDAYAQAVGRLEGASDARA